MKTCARGHTYKGDENYRARQGWCPVCFREVQKRYVRTEKGLRARERYAQSDNGIETKRKGNARSNTRRIRVGNVYLGTCGFSVSETEAILDGSTD